MRFAIKGTVKMFFETFLSAGNSFVMQTGNAVLASTMYVKWTVLFCPHISIISFYIFVWSHIKVIIFAKIKTLKGRQTSCQHVNTIESKLFQRCPQPPAPWRGFCPDLDSPSLLPDSFSNFLTISEKKMFTSSTIRQVRNIGMFYMYKIMCCYKQLSNNVSFSLKMYFNYCITSFLTLSIIIGSHFNW